MENQPSTQSADCKKCNKTFPSFDALHRHKMRSKFHIVCEVCSQDFSSHLAAKIHHDQASSLLNLQNHAHEQNLACLLCKKHFSRLGGLISHFEVGDCPGIHSRKELAEKEKLKHNKNLQGIHNNTSLSDSVIKEPTPLVKLTPQLPQVVFEDDNLISFDDPSAILNSQWDVPSVIPVPTYNNEKFPILGSVAGSMSGKGKGIAQSTVNKASVAPSEITQPAINVVNKELSSDPFNPDNPEFDITRFWIPFLSKYKCPHLGCNKSMPKPGAFREHLRSPAHRDEKLRCNRCYRYFASATALTQHSESQGLRCKIREDGKYHYVVDAITGGTATTAGRHDDDTIKYALQTHMDPANAANAIAEANRRETEANIEYRANFWKNHKVKKG